LATFQLGEQHFAVHQVFRTAESYNVDFIFAMAFSFQNEKVRGQNYEKLK
jgi:hypothetical protein